MRILILVFMFALISCGKEGSSGNNNSNTSGIYGLAGKTAECSSSSLITEYNANQGELEILESCYNELKLSETDKIELSMDPTKIKYYISNNKLSFLDDYGQTLFSLDRKDGASAQSIYGTWGLSETQGNITCDSYYQFNTNSTLLKVNCNEK